jgi:hypothetical protein
MLEELGVGWCPKVISWAKVEGVKLIDIRDGMFLI